MQRYEMLVNAQFAEPGPAALALDAHVLLLVGHVNDGHLISSPIAASATRSPQEQATAKSSILDDFQEAPRGMAAPYPFRLMQSFSVRGYRLPSDALDVELPETSKLHRGPDRPALAPQNTGLPSKVAPGVPDRHDDGQGGSAGLAARSEQRARSLAAAYAAVRADAEQDRSFLESTLGRFSRTLLGVEAGRAAAPLPQIPMQIETAECRSGARRVVDSLTTRQRQVMVSVLAGRPNKLIAEDLHISQRTVENHRAAVMAKTGSRSLPALARMGLVAGIESEPVRDGRSSGESRVPSIEGPRQIRS